MYLRSIALSAALSTLALSASVSKDDFPRSCPAPGKTLATPTYGKDVVFTSCGNASILPCYAQEYQQSNNTAKEENPLTLTSAASPKDVLRIIQDFDSYHLWDSFTVNVTKETPGPYGINTTMLFETVGLLPEHTYSNETITHYSEKITNVPGEKGPVLRSTWKFSPPAGTPLMAEHVNLVFEEGDGGSRYVSWESYYGAAAVLEQVLLEYNLQKQFVQQGLDLKAWAESGH